MTPNNAALTAISALLLTGCGGAVKVYHSPYAEAVTPETNVAVRFDEATDAVATVKYAPPLEWRELYFWGSNAPEVQLATVMRGLTETCTANPREVFIYRTDGDLKEGQDGEQIAKAFAQRSGASLVTLTTWPIEINDGYDFKHSLQKHRREQERHFYARDKRVENYYVGVTYDQGTDKSCVERTLQK